MPHQMQHQQILQPPPQLQQQPHQIPTYYYPSPYMPNYPGGAPPQLDLNSAANWSQAMAAATMAMSAAVSNDPMSIAAYMAGYQPQQPPEGVPNYSDPFTFGQFTPAFGFGYQPGGEYQPGAQNGISNGQGQIWTGGSPVLNPVTGMVNTSPVLTMQQVD